LVAIDQHGAILADAHFATGEKNLIDAVEALPAQTHLTLEASSLAGWIRGVITGHVERVVVGDPRRNAWIARDPRKSDRVDAYKLARLLRLGEVHEVYYPDDEHRRVFKQLVQHYDDLTAQQVRLKNKIKARLRAHGVILRGRGSPYSEQGRAAALEQIRSPEVRVIIGQLYRLLDETLATREESRALMNRESQRYSEIARFREVPGIGLICACRFSAYVQNPHRFSSKRKLWRYCGLAITDRRSDGKRLGRQRLDRSTGNTRLKDMSRKAFQGAMRTKAENDFQRCYRQSLEKTHNPIHARLTTQRKILAVLRALWMNGTHYQDACA
jgi:transposase